MHRSRIGAFDKQRRVTIPLKKILEFLMTDSSQQCWIVDLVTVEIKYWKNCAVTHGIQELVDVPGGGEWTSFSFTVANYRRNNQIRIVEYSSTRV